LCRPAVSTHARYREVLESYRGRSRSPADQGAENPEIPRPQRRPSPSSPGRSPTIYASMQGGPAAAEAFAWASTAADIPRDTTGLGCPALDGFLRGGLPCGFVTELTGSYRSGLHRLAEAQHHVAGLRRWRKGVLSLVSAAGEASAGKTQLALQALLTVQLPVAEGGLGGGSMWVAAVAPHSSRSPGEVTAPASWTRPQRTSRTSSPACAPSLATQIRLHGGKAAHRAASGHSRQPLQGVSLALRTRLQLQTHKKHSPRRVASPVQDSGKYIRMPLSR
jgi:hypothetical protein